MESSTGNTTIANASNTLTVPVSPKWVLHDRIGYFFPSGGNVQISNIIQKGNWRNVGSSERQLDASIEGPVFKMWFDHGAKPAEGKYEYIVVPEVADRSEMESYKISDIKIIKNTDSIQAVRHLGLDMLQVIFYKAGALTDGDVSISVNEPCAVMVKNLSTANPVLSIADPAQIKRNIEVAFKLPAIVGRERRFVAKLLGPVGTSTRYVLSDQIPETPITLITPIADSFVVNGTGAESNHGNESVLKLSNQSTGAVKEIFLKFDPSVLKRPIENGYAKLRIFLGDPAATVYPSEWMLYKTGNDWTETGINWNNRPVEQTAIGARWKASNGYINWDITDVINALPQGEILTLKLVMKDFTLAGSAQFNSKESELKPQISIEKPSLGPENLMATADSYVSSAAAEVNTNFGMANLLVSRRTVNDIFMKFDLSKLPGKVISARLKLKRFNSIRSDMTLHGVSDNSWTETGITFKNKPMAASTATITVAESNDIIYFDVMNLVKNISEDNLLSLKLTTASSTQNNTFYSNQASGADAAWRPVLELMVDTTWYFEPKPVAENLGVIADAYISGRAAEANQNYGKSIRLYVMPGVHDSFLKFDLNRAHGKILSAKLKLSRVVSFDNASELQLYSVSDNSWTEDGITFNNRPMAGQMLTSTSNDKQAVSFDVTSLIKDASEDGLLSVKLFAPSGALTAYVHSNQATDPKLRPVLECMIDPNGYDAPVMLAKADIRAIKLRLADIQGSEGEESNTALDIVPSNLITPNGDGRNDTWLIKNISMYPKNSVKIFSINGQLIYDKQSYDNSWNASYNGAPLPDGAYVYIIDKGDQTPLVKGVLNVISAFK